MLFSLLQHHTWPYSTITLYHITLHFTYNYNTTKTPYSCHYSTHIHTRINYTDVRITKVLMRKFKTQIQRIKSEIVEIISR